MLVQLLRESVLIQALITLVMVFAASLIAVQGRNPPDWLVQALMLILGFYFGSKVERVIASSMHR